MKDGWTPREVVAALVALVLGIAQAYQIATKEPPPPPTSCLSELKVITSNYTDQLELLRSTCR